MDKLREIDSSTLEELTRIRRQQDVVQSYLSKAEELKDRVDAIVFERVLEDYKCRHAALEEQARPLEDKAREQYRRLQSLTDEIASAVEEARLVMEELEFRRSVGELSEEHIHTRLKEAEQLLERRRSEQAEAARLETLFVTAFRSKEALEAEKASPVPGVHTVAVQAPSPPVKTDRTKQPEKPRGKAGAESYSPDETVIVPSKLLQSVKSKKSKTSEGPGVSAEPTSSTFDDTIIVPDAKLIDQKKGESQAEYRLGVLNYIGRNEENHIHLEGRGVSRKHALIMAGRGGFVLKDLESRCGTFVNDKRIKECRLSDGDRVRIGEVKLVFRLS